MMFIILRASVHVKLPKLAAGGQEQLQAVADQFQLQVRLFSFHDILWHNSNNEIICKVCITFSGAWLCR